MPARGHQATVFAFDLRYVGKIAATETCLVLPVFFPFQWFLNFQQLCRFHTE